MPIGMLRNHLHCAEILIRHSKTFISPTTGNNNKSDLVLRSSSSQSTISSSTSRNSSDDSGEESAATTSETTTTTMLTKNHQKTLINTDKNVAKLIELERLRQEESLILIASENYASKSIIEAQASEFINKYAAKYKTAPDKPSCVPDTIPIITNPACPIEL